jgi:hypothetical protein
MVTGSPCLNTSAPIFGKPRAGEADGFGPLKLEEEAVPQEANKHGGCGGYNDGQPVKFHLHDRQFFILI